MERQAANLWLMVVGWMPAQVEGLMLVASSTPALAVGLTPAVVGSVLEEGLMFVVEDSRPVAVRRQVSVQEVEGSAISRSGVSTLGTRKAASGIRHVCLSRAL